LVVGIGKRKKFGSREVFKKRRENAKIEEYLKKKSEGGKQGGGGVNLKFRDKRRRGGKGVHKPDSDRSTKNESKKEGKRGKEK